MGSVTPPARLSPPVPLAGEHDLTHFDCGEPALDDWLRLRARKNESRCSRTYVACDAERVAAYVCISAGSIQRADAPANLRRNAPDPLPIAIIGRLAVDRAYAGRGLGGDLLGDALRRIAHASRTIGIAAVLVQAKSEAARQFYMSCAEFTAFPSDSRTLFLPIETLRRALPE